MSESSNILIYANSFKDSELIKSWKKKLRIRGETYKSRIIKLIEEDEKEIIKLQISKRAGFS